MKICGDCEFYDSVFCKTCDGQSFDESKVADVFKSKDT